MIGFFDGTAFISSPKHVFLISSGLQSIRLYMVIPSQKKQKYFDDQYFNTNILSKQKLCIFTPTFHKKKIKCQQKKHAVKTEQKDCIVIMAQQRRTKNDHMYKESFPTPYRTYYNSTKRKFTFKTILQILTNLLSEVTSIFT